MQRRRPTIASLLLAFASAGAVVVTPRSSTRADPPSSPDLGTSEPSLAYLPANDSVVLAYDDQSGAYDASTGSLSTKASVSWAGVARSLDHGRTWSRGDPIPPASASCGDPSCATSLLGAPLVVADLDQTRVFYTSLAGTNLRSADLPWPDAVAISWSSDGATWAPPRVALEMPDGIADKYSIDMGYASVTIAVSSIKDGEIYMTSADRIEPEGPAFRDLNILPLGDAGARKVRPIVRLRDPFNGYLAYMIPRDAMNARYDVVVARITRFKKTPIAAPPGYEIVVVPWFVEVTMFRREGILINPSIPGALDRHWRDIYPITMENGAPFGDHVYLALREYRPDYGRSVVTTYDCDDHSLYCLVDRGNQSWGVHEFDDCTAHGDQLQPTLSSQKFGYRVGLSWYEQVSFDPTDPRLTVKGITTNDSGGWGEIHDLHFNAPFAPCPSGDAPSFTVGTFGDTFAGLILADGTSITAHTSSSSCAARNDLTSDQHVATVVW